MTGISRNTLRLVGLAALATSLAACGQASPSQDKLANFSIDDAVGGEDWALEGEYDWKGDDLAPLPDALPMKVADSGGYAYAPSWDYRADSFVEYEPEQFGAERPAYDDADGYDEYRNYEGYGDGYAPYEGDQSDYYEDSAGSDQYAWLALAAVVANVIGDSPPDYGFDHHGIRPWAWRTGEGYVRYSEPVRGGHRYYYYAPGAARPFLVRDPHYSYGYRGERLAAIYDHDGRLLNRRAVIRQRRAARHYFERAQQLHTAGRAEHRHGVSARRWEVRRAAVQADRRAFDRARERREAWQEWNERHERGLRQRWRQEREAREAASQRYEQWQIASYSGPAPRLYEEQRRERERRIAAREQRRAESLRQQRETAREAAAERRAAREEREGDRRAALAAQGNDTRTLRWRNGRLSGQDSVASQPISRDTRGQPNRLAIQRERNDRAGVLQRRQQSAAVQREQRREATASAVQARNQAAGRQQARFQAQERRAEAQRERQQQLAAQREREERQAAARDRRAELAAQRAQAQRRAQAQQQAATERRQQQAAQREERQRLAAQRAAEAQRLAAVREERAQRAAQAREQQLRREAAQQERLQRQAVAAEQRRQLAAQREQARQQAAERQQRQLEAQQARQRQMAAQQERQRLAAQRAEQARLRTQGQQQPNALQRPQVSRSQAGRAGRVVEDQ